MVARKALTATLAAGLIFGSTAVAAAPAGANSVRSSSAVDRAEGLSSAGWLVALLALGGIIAVIASDSKDDAPVSR